jgi:large subunit ribosomal protein L15
MKLNEISVDKSKIKKKKRIARGIGSGKGKTGGRGMKGQKSRSGVSINGFEGGQMPIHMRMPKHGFKSRKKVKKVVFKTDIVNSLIERKIIKENSNLTIKDLINLSNSKKNVFVKILFGQKLLKSVKIESHAASKSAIKEFERIGGSINIVQFKKPRIVNDVETKETAKKDQKKAIDTSEKIIKPKKVLAKEVLKTDKETKGLKKTSKKKDNK